MSSLISLDHPEHPGPDYLPTDQDLAEEAKHQEAIADFASEAVDHARKARNNFILAKVHFDKLRDLDDEYEFPDDLDDILTDAVKASEEIVGNAEDFAGEPGSQERVMSAFRSVHAALRGVKGALLLAEYEHRSEDDAIFSMAAGEATDTCAAIIAKLTGWRGI